MHPEDVTVVIPARNESDSIVDVVAGLRRQHPGIRVLVVDDGSTDGTGAAAASAGAEVVRHLYSKGNGAAIKTGARSATGEVLVFMDADGQHLAAEVGKLLGPMEQGYDMVVGARMPVGHANSGRQFANLIYNRFASWIVGHRIPDLTSGFRAVRRSRFVEFLYLLPNGFSYPTTITMAFFRTGYSVGYVPVEVARRRGKSHISAWRDGLKFLLIIFRVGTLYSPLRIFFPIAAIQAFAGLGYYAYTYLAQERFTNMSALVLTGALITFLFGLLSEQITSLIYKRTES